jgi:hypothetical protein
MDKAWLSTLEAASVIPTVKLKVPAFVGVPVMAPEDVFSDKPVGREPEAIDQVYEGVPPVAVSV